MGSGYEWESRSEDEDGQGDGSSADLREHVLHRVQANALDRRAVQAIVQQVRREVSAALDVVHPWPAEHEPAEHVVVRALVRLDKGPAPKHERERHGLGRVARLQHREGL
eukprot:9494940-Pyramimonas_sp.AAC.1